MDELRITKVEREDMPVLEVTRDGNPGEVAGAAMSDLEQALPSLRGRHFYGYYDPPANRYVACVEAQAGDPPAITRGAIPGGTYARARIFGDAPELYTRIGPTFDLIAGQVSVDRSRPWLEFYRSEHQVDLLVPVTTP